MGDNQFSNNNENGFFSPEQQYNTYPSQNQFMQNNQPPHTYNNYVPQQIPRENEQINFDNETAFYEGSQINTNYNDDYTNSAAEQICRNLTDEYKKKSKKINTFFWCILPVIAVLIGICAGYVINHWSNIEVSTQNNKSNNLSGGTSEEGAENYANPNGPQIESQETPSGSGNNGTILNNAETAYETICDSVVSVRVYSNSGTGGSQGSGVIIDNSGYIATNSHVIGDTRDVRVSVILSNNKVYSADVIGFDADIDLAVIKIDCDNLTPANFANSDNIKIGQVALAIGCPYGSGFSNSLTQGIVSAVDRTLTLSTTVKYIQTDAAINPGNSGGPLINVYGQVIGINTAKISATGYEGMGFAIPSNTVIEVVNQIIKNGYVPARARLGATVALLSSNNEYGLDYGVEIVEFAETTAFSGSSVKEGDIILEMDGVKIYSFEDINTVLNSHSPNDSIQVVMYRPETNQKYNDTITFISSSSL